MLEWDRRQRGVALGMAAGLLASLAIVSVGPSLFVQTSASLKLGLALLLPASALFVAIARVAKQRFFTPADIEGSGLSKGTGRVRLLQSLLQNTTEQLALAVPVYLAALSNPHAAVQAAAPACACAFFLARLLFFATYARGAAARSFGFALTFYPTVLLLFWQLLRLGGFVG